MRWHAIVFYRTDAGLIEVEHDYDEIGDLHDFIEKGPSFCCIDRIEIRYCGEKMTIEQSEAA